MQKLSPELRGSAPIFAALGDVTRLTLVTRLAGGEPLSITRLSEGTDVTRQAITKHLRVLEEASLVRGSRHGREQLWELNPRQLAEARRAIELIARQWDAALLRLKNHLEEEKAE
jgi:DNA-binding transcriptional ArsR family regulator